MSGLRGDEVDDCATPKTRHAVGCTLALAIDWGNYLRVEFFFSWLRSAGIQYYTGRHVREDYALTMRFFFFSDRKHQVEEALEGEVGDRGQ